MPDSSLRRRVGPKLVNDPDRYIRRVKGGRYQARPWDLGTRYNLGLFATPHEARRAIHDFWWGKRADLPKHTRRVHFLSGPRYAAMRPGGGPVLGFYDTREEAAARVASYLRQRLQWVVSPICKAASPRTHSL